MRYLKLAIFLIILIILIRIKVFSFLLQLTGEFMKFILWLFQLSLTDFGLSPFIEIGIKTLTFVLSYALVGIVFNVLGFFDSNAMKIAYFILCSTKVLLS